MTIKFFLRDRNLSNGVEVPVYVRVINGKSFDRKVKTRLSIRPDFWDSKKESIKSRITFDERKRNDFNSEISKLREFINTSFSREKNINELPSRWLSECIENFYNPGHHSTSQRIFSLSKITVKDLKQHLPDSKDNSLSFFNIYDKFVERQDISDSRARQYKVIKSTLERYQLFVRHTVPGMRKYLIELNQIDSNFLQDFYSFVENENIYFEKYPLVFRAIKKKAPKPRSKNTMTDLFKKFRAFLNWCYVQEYISTKPFTKFKLETETYGTPFFLTLEELRLIHNINFTDDPLLNIQKDVFVFQCCIGCRVGDLMNLKKTDIIDGNIEYIPHKTIKETGKTVIVPLNNMAREIVDKYFNILEGDLLPFSSPQKYNDSIKIILERCGITRRVTILDPLTRTEKKVPINEVATSHMARRTFIGNIYKKVKDPNLVASLTGHSEGSKAFCRYREIDTEMKRELVGLLD
jgi:integrase